MTHVLDAIYEGGSFRPLAPPKAALSEGQQVRIVIESDGPEDILQMAARVYSGLSEPDVEDIERIALDRSNFFTKQS